MFNSIYEYLLPNKKDNAFTLKNFNMLIDKHNTLLNDYEITKKTLQYSKQDNIKLKRDLDYQMDLLEILKQDHYDSNNIVYELRHKENKNNKIIQELKNKNDSSIKIVHELSNKNNSSIKTIQELTSKNNNSIKTIQELKDKIKTQKLHKRKMPFKNIKRKKLDRGSGRKGETNQVDFDQYERDPFIDGNFMSNSNKMKYIEDENFYMESKFNENPKKNNGYVNDGFVVNDY